MKMTTSPNDPNDPRHQLALFRHSVISSLLHREEDATLQEMMQRKSEMRYDIPGSPRTHVAVETMRGWLRAYRKGGYEALLPKVRNDMGTARAIPQPVADFLCQAKEDNPSFTVPLAIAFAIAFAIDKGVVPEGLVLAPSTVHRLFSSKGLMRKRVSEPTSKDRRKFTAERAGDLWMSDVMHGIGVLRDDRRKHKTYLIAIIDDASRLVPHGTFAFNETTEAYLLDHLGKASIDRLLEGAEGESVTVKVQTANEAPRDVVIPLTKF